MSKRCLLTVWTLKRLWEFVKLVETIRLIFSSYIEKNNFKSSFYSWKFKKYLHDGSGSSFSRVHHCRKMHFDLVNQRIVRLQLRPLQVYYFHLIQIPFDTEDPVWWRRIKLVLEKLRIDKDVTIVKIVKDYFSSFSKWLGSLFYTYCSNCDEERSISIKMVLWFDLKVLQTQEYNVACSSCRIL